METCLSIDLCKKENYDFQQFNNFKIKFDSKQFYLLKQSSKIIQGFNLAT